MINDSQSVGLIGEVASSGTMQKTQILGLHPTPAKSEILGLGPAVCFNKPSKWFRYAYMLMTENRCFTSVILDPGQTLELPGKLLQFPIFRGHSKCIKPEFQSFRPRK